MGAEDLQKIAVKLFVENPAAVRLREIVPVFHRWIQKGSVDGMLIDVADYGHLPDGPGVVLVGHEGDYSMDAMEGPLGLLYTRRQPLPGPLPDRVRSCLKAALRACAALEGDPLFEGTFRFRTGEALFLANDRLLAPNTEEAFAALRPGLESAFGALWGGRVELARDATDPRRRLAVQVKGAEAAGDAASLLARLEAQGPRPRFIQGWGSPAGTRSSTAARGVGRGP